jgi:hypothetical protein
VRCSVDECADETASGNHYAAAAFLRDVQWHDSTAIFSWHTIGVWPEASVASVDATHEPTCAHALEALLVVGDSGGYVSIYNNPCPRRGVRKLATERL